jgi:hypothetical protein
MRTTPLTLLLSTLFVIICFSCKKECEKNQPPIADAGISTSITLPLDTITLVGLGTDADGQVVSYLWNKVSGPTSFSISNALSPSPLLSDLTQGVYIFQLTVTDNEGATGSDTVSVTVIQQNQPPVANAGRDTSITLPRDSISLVGNGNDADGQVVSYLWSKISGPASSIISNASSSTALLTGMTEGAYSFQLTVTDDDGATGSDTVMVTVKPAVIVDGALSPSPNPDEVHIHGNSSYEGSDPNAPEIGGAAWTDGSVVGMRAALKFDLSSIPSDAIINSATLSLYSNPTPLNGNHVDANFGSDNSLLIQQITNS